MKFFVFLLCALAIAIPAAAWKIEFTDGEGTFQTFEMTWALPAYLVTPVDWHAPTGTVDSDIDVGAYQAKLLQMGGPSGGTHLYAVWCVVEVGSGQRCARQARDFVVQ